MREALIKKRTSEVGWAGLSGAPNAQVAILRCLLVLKRLYLDSIEAKGCWRYGTVLVGYGNKDMNDPVFLSTVVCSCVVDVAVAADRFHDAFPRSS